MKSHNRCHIVPIANQFKETTFIDIYKDLVMTELVVYINCIQTPNANISAVTINCLVSSCYKFETMVDVMWKNMFYIIFLKVLHEIYSLHKHI